jgi:hypothetical protein
MTDPFLNMIAHGTTGSDGIEAGIHLRWAFDAKLGFPACFQLYRRSTDLKRVFTYDFNQLLDNGRDLPYQQKGPSDTRFQVKLRARNEAGEAVSALTSRWVTIDSGQQVAAILWDGTLRFDFNAPTNRLELGFQIGPDTDFEITAHGESKSYRPLKIKGLY